MDVNFEELDYQQTALGELILWRRRALEVDGREIFEVKLNGEYLMSTLFHEAEVAVTDLALAEFPVQTHLNNELPALRCGAFNARLGTRQPQFHHSHQVRDLLGERPISIAELISDRVELLRAVHSGQAPVQRYPLLLIRQHPRPRAERAP